MEFEESETHEYPPPCERLAVSRAEHLLREQEVPLQRDDLPHARMFVCAKCGGHCESGGAAEWCENLRHVRVLVVGGRRPTPMRVAHAGHKHARNVLQDTCGMRETRVPC
jgi:hypothetical protein